MQNSGSINLGSIEIAKSFEASSERIFSRAALHRFVGENAESWLIEETRAERLAQKPGRLLSARSAQPGDMIAAVVDATQLGEVRLKFPYRAVQRFTWGDIPTLELLQSIDDEGYFSHFTAMHLHGLTDQLPKTIYFNVEQAATGGGGELRQENIDRAFKGKCRVSKNVIKFRNQTICKVNGMNTGNLGVVRMIPENADYSIRTTNVERTLVDAAVRPVYAGGVAEVAKAYESAANDVSINKVAAYLRQLGHTYPYHQAVGFYLDRAGVYTDSQIRLLRDFPIEFDFYLTYQMKNPEYVERWRLFVPKGFQ